MPSPELSHRTQKALLWEFTGYDDYGQPKRSATSVEINVRWTSKFSRMRDASGNDVNVVATVVVDRDIALGSTMWQGSQQDLEESVPGTGAQESLVPTSDLMEVVAVSEVPDLKGRASRRTVGLARVSDEAPESAAVP